MSDTTCPHKPGARLAIELARIMGDPLPDDWCDPEAVKRRRAHIHAVAFLLGEVALEALVDQEAARQPVADQDGQLAERARGTLLAFGNELEAADRAMRQYTHETQRDDVMTIVRAGMTLSVGAHLATTVMMILDTCRR